MSNMFLSMWEQQEQFMNLLCEKRSFPKYPVDIKSKEGQSFLKGITYECMGELFEANQELKNSKSHRESRVDDFNMDLYVEELTDALHYLLEIAICSGVSHGEFYDSYMKKGLTNIKRINEGY